MSDYFVFWMRRGGTRAWVLCLCSALYLLTGACLAGASDLLAIPPLSQRVSDLTGTLSAEQKSSLESISAQLEAETGAQLALLMLPTTRPETIEAFSIRVAEAWKLGRKGLDDGLILVVAKEDRRMRLEVGYGLEGRIPDALAKRLISEQMVPRFKQGDYYAGLASMFRSLATLVHEENQRVPQHALAISPVSETTIGATSFIAAFSMCLLLGPFLRRWLGNLLGSLCMITGVFFLGMGLDGEAAGGILALLYGIVMAPLGFIVDAFLPSPAQVPCEKDRPDPAGRHPHDKKRRKEGKHRRQTSDITDKRYVGESSSIVAASSSESSQETISFSDFSGGGGSFGGGGASGEW